MSKRKVVDPELKKLRDKLGELLITKRGITILSGTMTDEERVELEKEGTRQDTETKISDIKKQIARYQLYKQLMNSDESEKEKEGKLK